MADESVTQSEQALSKHSACPCPPALWGGRHHCAHVVEEEPEARSA